ncbi:MAG: hypothetical protein KJ006_09570 [Thermoleophilia bacterium]|nr:hypothetical protein [Thermoleophilia bacterium]
MASLAHLPSIGFQGRLLRLARPATVSPVALVLVVLALGGAGWALLGPTTAAPATTAPAPLTTPPSGPPRGDIPIIGDPIRDLTIWWSNRLSDASRAGLDSLRGRYLTPIDPMADEVIKTLYGKILVITIPLLTLGGMILGYLIMTARTTGETAYSARAVTPRFVTGATLSVLGIFLVSVFAQFVIATDAAMIGVSIPGEAVGDPAGWPASGGVFEVLQKVSFDPRIPEGPNNWNDGAWLSAGMSAAILVTLLQMVNAALSAVERLMVLVGPICLAAYALPATQRITNAWLKVLLAILLVRFAWTIVFVLFSLEGLAHLNADGVPPTVGDTNALLGLATGCALLSLLLPFALIPVALHGPGPLRTES